MFKEKIQRDIIQSMKNGEKDKRDTLRFLMSQIKLEEVNKRTELSENEIIAVLKKEIKQTAQARAIKDTDELKWREEFLMTYLPEQLPATTIYLIVSEYRENQPDMKIAMRELMNKYGSVVDKRILSDTIRRVYN